MGLSQLQERVARSFFALPESAGFALAGGAALVVQRLVDRTTRDLDFFGPEQLAARRAADALQAALVAGGLHCERVRDHATFVRLAVADGDQITEVDVCYDHQWRPSVPTDVGPARSPEELAVDKLLALYGRALPRDFVDVYRLHQICGIEAMMRWAPEKDRGFSGYRLAETLGTMARFRRAEFEIDDDSYADLETFFAGLRAELIHRTVEEGR
jgi:hypothetical protein